MQWDKEVQDAMSYFRVVAAKWKILALFESKEGV
jgi:hypothetical protein